MTTGGTNPGTSKPRVVDPWITAIQAASGVGESLSTFLGKVEKGLWPAPYHMAPDRPLWKLSEVIVAHAEHGGRSAGLLARLPVDGNGRRILPKGLAEAMGRHAQHRERFVASLPLELQSKGAAA